MSDSYVDLNPTMDRVAELNKTHGVKQRGGKMYTQVVHRMEAFRKEHGTLFGVDTQILVDDGHRVVIKAIITHAITGAVVGSGMAEEIRGQGHVNTTSALENAETSAVGRALASLGLAGGEYASANEMEAVQRKSDAIQQQPTQKAEEPPQKPVEEVEAISMNVADAEKWMQDVSEKLESINTLAGLKDYMSQSAVRGRMKGLEKGNAVMYKMAKTLFQIKKDQLA
jgi:hypothetical protein